ncbi:MAG: helix-turn-helix domain-containing protein [Haloarculaceae archaeon]
MEGDTGTDGEADDEGITVERQSPEAAFALLGDETRVGIIRALGETPDEPMPFAELQRRVGIRDSGGFNYHLRKLRGSFVRRVDGGYELTYAGRQVVGAIYAGTYTANATVDAIPVEGECPVCGSDLVAEYAEETARIRCTGCEEWRNEFGFPPGSLDQFSRQELPAAFDRWMQHVFGGILAGFCYTCAGRMDGRLVPDATDERIAGVPAHAEFECGRCGSTARASGAMPALFHPGVQGFLYEHGFDVRSDPSWSLGTASLPDISLESADPLRLAVTFEAGGESVTAAVESDTSVSAVERDDGGA